MLRVSKFFYQEAGSYLYSHNTFVIGNGWHRSRREPSIHSLRQLQKRMSSSRLRDIRHVIFNLHVGAYARRPGYVTQQLMPEELAVLVKFVLEQVGEDLSIKVRFERTHSQGTNAKSFSVRDRKNVLNALRRMMRSGNIQTMQVADLGFEDDHPDAWICPGLVSEGFLDAAHEICGTHWVGYTRDTDPLHDGMHAPWVET
jgi:hypothetical protein